MNETQLSTFLCVKYIYINLTGKVCKFFIKFIEVNMIYRCRDLCNLFYLNNKFNFKNTNIHVK